MNIGYALTRAAGSLLLGISLAGLSACSSGSGEAGTIDESRSERTLAEAIDATPEMSTVTAALDGTGLKGVFEGTASYTFLAPTDDAFAALGESGKQLTGDGQQALLAAILREHLVPGTLTPDAIRDAINQAGGSVTMRTLGSGTVSFAERDGKLVVTGPDGRKAQMAGAATAASNGMLIPLDGFLVALPDAS